MTAKYQFLFENNTDLFQRQSVSARILFAISADDIPDITKLLEPDANGHYTDLSFTNGQEYKKYHWTKSLDASQSYTQPTNRFPGSNYNTTSKVVIVNFQADGIRDILNVEIFVRTTADIVSIKIIVMFKNLLADLEQM